MNEKLQRYSELSSHIKLLSEEKAVLQKAILQDLDDSGTKKVDTIFGKFTKSTRTSYKYSAKVKALDEKLKLAKIKEEEKGIAKPQVSEYLTYTPVKE